MQRERCVLSNATRTKDHFVFVMATPYVIKRKWKITPNLFRLVACFSKTLRHFLSWLMSNKKNAMGHWMFSSVVVLVSFLSLICLLEVKFIKSYDLRQSLQKVQREEIWTKTCPRPRVVTCCWLQTRSKIVTSGSWLWLTREFPTRSSYFTEIRLGFGRNRSHSFDWNPALLQKTRTARSP